MENRRVITMMLLVALSLTFESVEAEEETTTSYFAVRIRDDIVGFSEERRSTTHFQGRNVGLASSERFLKLSLLGMPLDQREKTRTYFDPVTDRPLRIEYEATVGVNTTSITASFGEGSIDCETRLNGGLVERKKLPAGPEVLASWSNEFFVYLAGLLPKEEPGSYRDLRIFVLAARKIAEATVSYQGRETIEVVNQKISAGHYELTMDDVGLRAHFWIGGVPSHLLRIAYPDRGMEMFEVDALVATTLKRAEVTDSIMVRTNEQIDDIRSVTRMVIEAQIATFGGTVSEESLNVPGQRFVGTASDTAVDGKFDIEPIRYGGEGAPAFPVKIDGSASLSAYLSPTPDIESDAPEIRRLAQEQTIGVSNAWDAAVTLADWVSNNIEGDIPGGGTALGTLTTRKGECGGHSRLHAALCRAVGIPARVVTGGTYTPAYGGSFGQHAWVEVYMGAEAGWMPIDATAGEVDRIDAGHIRLGENAAFRPTSITILDYEPRTEATVLLSRDRPLPFTLKAPHRYVYLVDGSEVGSESFQIEEGMFAGREVYVLNSVVKIGSTESTAKVIVTRTGRPLQYHSQGKSGSVSFEIDCQFETDKVTASIMREDLAFQKEIPLPAESFLIDNNNMALMALLFSRLKLSPGQEGVVRVFHPSSLSVLPFAIGVGAVEPIRVNGKDFETYPLSIQIAGQSLTAYVTSDGLLIRQVEQNGRIHIDYSSPNP